MKSTLWQTKNRGNLIPADADCAIPKPAPEEDSAPEENADEVTA